MLREGREVGASVRLPPLGGVTGGVGLAGPGARRSRLLTREVLLPRITRPGSVHRFEGDRGDRRRLGRGHREELLRARCLEHAPRITARAVCEQDPRLADIAAAIEREGKGQDRDAQRLVLCLVKRLPKRRHGVVQPGRAGRHGRDPRLHGSRSTLGVREGRGPRQERPVRLCGLGRMPRPREHARPGEQGERIIERAGIERLALAKRREGLVEVAQGRERAPLEHPRRRVPREHVVRLMGRREGGLRHPRGPGELGGGAREQIAVATQIGRLRAIPDVRRRRPPALAPALGRPAVRPDPRGRLGKREDNGQEHGGERSADDDGGAILARGLPRFRRGLVFSGPPPFVPVPVPVPVPEAAR